MMEIIFILFLLWLGYKFIKWAFIALAYVFVFIVFGGLCIYESVKNKENIEQLIKRLKSVNKVPPDPRTPGKDYFDES